MIIVRLQGGLGNQMFQYAAGRTIAHRNRVPLKLDMSSFEEEKARVYRLSTLNVLEDFATPDDFEKVFPRRRRVLARAWVEIRKRRAYEARPFVHERSPAFDPAILRARNNTYLVGYWQSERYFAEIADLIRREFTPRVELPGLDADLSQEIDATNSVSLHVRRGDYVSNPIAAAMHGALPLSYYSRALTLMGERVENPRVFVFSDDIPWARANLESHLPLCFVEQKGPDADIADMWLMSRCKHHIIANSSFSWWGAWLNPRPDKVVVAPEPWFTDPKRDPTDIVPEGWLRV